MDVRVNSIDTGRHFERSAGLYADAVAPLFAASHEHMRRLVRELRPRRLLDLACGDGRVAATAAARDAEAATGLDRSAALLARARDREPGVHWVRGDGHALPFADAAFDLIICNLALAMFDAPVRAAVELRRVTARGGRVVASGLGSTLNGAGRPEPAGGEHTDPAVPAARTIVTALRAGGLRVTGADRTRSTTRITDVDVLGAVLAGEVGPGPSGQPGRARKVAGALLDRTSGVLDVHFDFVFVHATADDATTERR
jgi:SAM-dependent methyltransferase